jgi:putative oxidoreductase
LAVGLTLAAHGTQKLFGWFGLNLVARLNRAGPGLDVAGQFFAMIGFPPGRRDALKAGLAETGGGLLVALGFLTSLTAALLCSVMLVAAISVHIKKGFFIPSGGFEPTLVLGIAALTVAFTGPGSLSLDALLGRYLKAHSGDGCVVRHCPWRGHIAHTTTRSTDAAIGNRRVVIARRCLAGRDWINARTVIDGAVHAHTATA